MSRVLPLPVILLGLAGLAHAGPAAPASVPLGYSVKLETLSAGHDGKTNWMHPRAAVIPGKVPSIVVTMQKSQLGMSDFYYAVSSIRSDDLGRTWSAPVDHAGTARRKQDENLEVGVADFVPAWHDRSGRLLGLGLEVQYSPKGKNIDAAGRTAYAVYDNARRDWAPWKTLVLPDDPKYHYAGPGCGQRVDLADGTILLPIHYKPQGLAPYTTAVLRCSFDGDTLKMLSRGADVVRAFEPERPPMRANSHGAARQSGLFEPSLAFHQGRFYLTMRNDQAGYVAVSADGLNFETPRRWRFEDGKEIGNYNTQQHWVSHSDSLFLVYSRRGGGNDHIMRHRAPLFIAQVDTAKLCLVRSTERVLVPERGAPLGNFGANAVNAQESWVTTSEWLGVTMRPGSQADNSVFAARIVWDRPNRLEVPSLPVGASSGQ